MKTPQKLSRSQNLACRVAGLNPDEWMCIPDIMSGHIRIINKYTGKVIVIPKVRKDKNHGKSERAERTER